MDDSSVVAQLRKGDPAAFDAAYERFRPRLWSFLARLCRDRGVAEDLLQETWLRLARGALRLEPETNLAAWLFTVARNLHASHYRWTLVDAERLRMFRFLSRSQDLDTPFDLASASETERRLEAAIGALAPKYREVLLLCAIEKFEPTEAARMIGIKPEALRQRLSRARAMVAEQIQSGEARTPSAGGWR